MPALITWFRQDAWALAPAAPEHVITSVGTDLLRCWTQPHRRYHTTRHLVEMFWALAELGEAEVISAREEALARISAWCHDAVYAIADPHAVDPPTPSALSNEAASAAYGWKALQSLGFDPDDLAVVDRLVRASERHDLPAPTGIDAAFHDADLWILSAPGERFDEYCEQVREEYASVSNEAYAAGRSAILAPLLTRDRLYASEHAHNAWTEAAQANLARELRRLVP